jgi:hypothetical protein
MSSGFMVLRLRVVHISVKALVCSIGQLLKPDDSDSLTLRRDAYDALSCGPPRDFEEIVTLACATPPSQCFNGVAQFPELTNPTPRRP